MAPSVFDQQDSFRSVSSAKIIGISCAVPSTISEVADLSAEFGEENITKIIKSTGVERRYIVKDECTSDLCATAAEQLFADMQIDRRSIDTLIFVSQTHDYTLPATACVLQHKLELPLTTAAFDVALGCSGYVYGLWLASSLISGGGSKRVLLLVGDTISKIVGEKDRSVAALFGDAGSATLIDYDPSATVTPFVLGTDGRGENHLIVPSGAFRDRCGEKYQDSDGESRNPFDLYMNGAEIFAFTLARVPPLVKALHDASEAMNRVVDKYVFHQANKFMLDHLAKRMKLPSEKTIVNSSDVGNTSSASIPLALTIDAKQADNRLNGNFLLAGFGVGYSWAGCVVHMDNVWVSPLTIG